MLPLIGALAACVLIVLWIKESNQATEDEEIKFDIIVKFNSGVAVPELDKYKRLQKVANWGLQGKGTYRGWSNLEKDKVKDLVLEEFEIKEEDVKVLNATDLFIVGL